MTDRIFRLMSRHQKLDDQLRSEMARSRPDSFRLWRLTHLKRVVKDRLNRLLPAAFPLTPAF